jgi:uncharacterized protein (TIGR02246 family)
MYKVMKCRNTVVWLLLSSLTIVGSLLPADEKTVDNSHAEQAILAVVDSYVTAYNRGDAKGVAEHWSDTGEWTSPSGQKYQGKKAIEQAMAELFKTNKGVRIEVLQPSIRLVSSDVAVEEGTVRVLSPHLPPTDSRYVAVHVKKAEQWKLDNVHEIEILETTAPSPSLQDLAWLVGEWVDPRSPEHAVSAIRWTKNKTFLNHTFKLEAPGEESLEGTVVIGWDPAAQTIRSWMFDSDGGFGEGVWTQKDNTWVITFKQVLADGRRASATNIYTYIDGNTCTWKSIGRKVEDEFLPNIEEVRLVRKGTAESK